MTPRSCRSAIIVVILAVFALLPPSIFAAGAVQWGVSTDVAIPNAFVP